MQTIYYIRYLDAGGEMLGFEMIRCDNDTEAMQAAVASALPKGCMSVEVARPNRFVWRGKTAQLATATH